MTSSKSPTYRTLPLGKKSSLTLKLEMSVTLSKTAGLVLAAVLDVAEVVEVMVRDEVVRELDAVEEEEEPDRGFLKF